MNLKPRTTYKNRNGTEVHIAGITRVHEQFYWSIEGDWYTHDGKFLGYTKVGKGEDDKPIWGYKPYGDDNYLNLVEELPPDPWWNGVVTERKR